MSNQELNITSDQIKKIHSMLPAQIKLDKEAKGDLVQQYTGEASRRSTRALKRSEAAQLIRDLSPDKVPSEQKSSDDLSHYARFDKDNKMHRTLLSHCFTLGWIRFDKRLNRNVADLNRLGGWIKNRSALKKPLKSHNHNELRGLVTQFQRLLK